jgi:hypothetical protein
LSLHFLMHFKNTYQRPKENKIYILWHRNKNTYTSTVIGVYEKENTAKKNLLLVEKNNKHKHCEIYLTEEFFDYEC